MSKTPKKHRETTLKQSHKLAPPGQQEVPDMAPPLALGGTKIGASTGALRHQVKCLLRQSTLPFMHSKEMSRIDCFSLKMHHAT